MSNEILRIEGLSHSYNGSAWAIRDINFKIDKTGILGLLGSNGAGKSTTMNILCGALNQTEGEVFIKGVNVHKQPQKAKKMLGFLPQVPPLHLDLTVQEYLVYCAELRLLSGDKLKSAVNEAKERCGVAHFSNRLIKNLSGGYRQRVGIAQAIVHHPKLVVLDEPTNGLDPNQITEVRALIKEIATERAVVFSSHILSEVQVLCKEIVMIEDGKIVFSDSMHAFNNYVEPHSLVLSLENPPHVSELLKISGVNKAQEITEREFRIHFSGELEVAERLAFASVQNGWRLRGLNIEKSSLDEIFKELSTKPTFNS